MIVQHYSDIIDYEYQEQICLGQPIFFDNEDKTVRGFIYKWDGKTAEILYFKPEETTLSSKQTFISDKFNEDVWVIFEKIIMSSPQDLKDWWVKIIKNNMK